MRKTCPHCLPHTSTVSCTHAHFISLQFERKVEGKIRVACLYVSWIRPPGPFQFRINFLKLPHLVDILVGLLGRGSTHS